MTRSMLVTVLARFDGKDTTGGETWYSKAMAWGVETGITDGANADANITRESLVVMLYRYAKAESAKGTALSEFSDAGQVSGWATEAMNWAVASGILNGAGGKLNPTAPASRAEVSTMLMEGKIPRSESGWQLQEKGPQSLRLRAFLHPRGREMFRAIIPLRGGDCFHKAEWRQPILQVIIPLRGGGCFNL